MSTVWVVNKTDADLNAGWAGAQYAFKQNAPVEIPLDAAQNIFGYGLDNKFEFVVRLGWTISSNDLPQAYERLSMFEISVERPTIYRASSPAVDQTPVPVIQRRERGKGTQAAA